MALLQQFQTISSPKAKPVKKPPAGFATFHYFTAESLEGGLLVTVTRVRGEIGPDLFRQACRFGLEGTVSDIAVAGKAHALKIPPSQFRLP